jgi:Fic family protein
MPYVHPPPPTTGILADLASNPAFINRMLELHRLGEVAPGGKYRHWDTLRHLEPPGGLTLEEWWAATKLARAGLMRELPLTDGQGAPFKFCMPDEAQALVHYVDQHASGEIAMAELVTADESAKRRFIVNSLIEEAIRSSQLEGATTSRVVAKEMIRSGRPPKNRSEKMIMNNYKAMEFIRSEMHETLTPTSVLELHRIVTDETLDEPTDAGRLQEPGEERVGLWEGDTLVYRPPPAEQLRDRLDLMCKFANGDINPPGFLHPVVRAVILHFWLAHDHPFVDGNGRTARVLFYWQMKKQGYWLTEYLSISKILREAPSRYGEAFLLSETDEGDLTYFVLFHLNIIKRGILDMQDYLRRKMLEVRETEALLRGDDRFNYRQLALLGDALRHPGNRYTFRSHAMSHSVVHQTARSDLLDLASRGLFTFRRVGRQYVFRPVEDLRDRVTGPEENLR